MRWLLALVVGLGSIVGGIWWRRGVYLDPQALADWSTGDLVPGAVLGWALIIGGVCLVTLAASHAMSAGLLSVRDEPAPGKAGGVASSERVPRARVVRR